MTTILLDTHTALWMVTDNPRLGDRARSLITDRHNEVLVSAASVWEAEVKRRLGRLSAPDELWTELEQSGVTYIDIDRDDAVAAAALPLHHRDPFDRMLIAQAGRRNASLMTADRWFDRYEVTVRRADE